MATGRTTRPNPMNSIKTSDTQLQRPGDARRLNLIDSLCARRGRGALWTAPAQGWRLYIGVWPA
jgi:hypothetical protein